MATSSYTDTRLLINGEWCDAASGKTLDVINPATGKAIGKVAHAASPISTGRWPPRNAASKPGARSRPTNVPLPCAKRPRWCANALPTSPV